MHLHREPVQPRPPVRRHRLARVRRPLPHQLRPRLQEQRGEQHLDPLAVRGEPEHRDGADPAAAELVQHRAAAQGRRRPAEQPGLARAVRIGDLHARGADLVEARLGRREQGHVDAVAGHQLDRLVRAGLGLLGRARPLGPGQQLADAPQRCARRPGARRPVHLVPSRSNACSVAHSSTGPDRQFRWGPAADLAADPLHGAPRRRRNRCRPACRTPVLRWKGHG